MLNCLICQSEFIPWKRQVYCNDCRASGKARKAILHKYNTSDKNKSIQRKWYYNDRMKTKESKNKYNRSEKGRACKRKYYLKNRERLIKEQLTTRRAETISRTHAHDLMKKTFPDRKCSHCGTNVRIVVHHKDRNPFNNDLVNLMYLCTSCHGKEHERLNNLAILPTS